MINVRGTTGVGGWLAVLVFTIGALIPLAQIGTAISLFNAEAALESYYDEAWPVYKASALIICALRAMTCLFVAKQLMYEKSPSTPRTAIIGIWVALGLLNVLSLAAFGILSPDPANLGAMAGTLFWPLMLAAIATAYLLKSKRVADTYGSA